MNLENIRNVCIIAHIDHWKSTLADRLLEITWSIDKRDMKHSQILDTMDIEQERGITIKLQPVRMMWKWFELNIIDTPWHVDFQYEVSRSLASVEAALLIVDATQWIEAQTLSNVYLAIENNLDIIPVINKIDLPSANIEKVSEEIINLLWCKKDEIISISAKTWENVEEVLDAIIEKCTKPKVFIDKDSLENNISKQELKALVFDSQYDSYRGVVSYVKVFSWEIKKWDSLTFLHTDKIIEALDLWYFSPKYVSSSKIENWSIWYIVTWLKSIRDARVWDTVWKPKEISWIKMKAVDAKAIEWFWDAVPFIYAWVFPMDNAQYPLFKDAIEKLVLNDASLKLEQEFSNALWHWYRAWFLWLLHLEIVKERLFREFWIDVIITSPQVNYIVNLLGNKVSQYSRFSPKLDILNSQEITKIMISNPEDLPDREKYLSIEEPIAKLEIISPYSYIGSIMQFAQERRAIFKNQQFIDTDRVMLSYELAMNEIIWDFYDEIKSLSSWYASMSYEFLRYNEDDIVKLEIIIADEKVEALSFICHKSQAHYIWWKICSKLKETIPRALFSIKIQAIVWWNVVARENISPLRKDVTAKLYWWDITRKRKLLDKQKKWKKKMKQFWKVSLSSDVFVNLLKK